MNACNTIMHRSVSKSAHMLLKDTCPKKAENPWGLGQGLNDFPLLIIDPCKLYNLQVKALYCKLCKNTFFLFQDLKKCWKRKCKGARVAVNFVHAALKCVDRCVAQNMDIFRIGTLNHKTQAHLKADLYTYLQKEKQSLCTWEEIMWWQFHFVCREVVLENHKRRMLALRCKYSITEWGHCNERGAALHLVLQEKH